MKTKSSIQLEEVACGVCGCRKYEHLFMAKDFIYGNEGEWPAAKCTGCGVVFMNPRIPPADIGPFYPKTYYTNVAEAQLRLPWLKNAIQDEVLRRKFGYPVTRRFSWTQAPAVAVGYALLSNWANYSRVIHYVGPKRRVLDVGCGNGGSLNLYKRLGWETYGAEVSEDSAQLAKRGGHNVFVGELEAGRYESNFFDAVTLWDALEHIHNPADTIREAFRIAKSDGKLYIAVPNFGSWYAPVFKDKWFMFTAPLHYYHYTKSTLKDLLERCGFRNVEIRFPLGDAGIRYTCQAVASRFRFLSALVAFFPVNAALRTVDYFMPRGHLLAIASK